MSASALSSGRLRTMLNSFPSRDDTPVILCIGTDRIIGDCLGPMVGSMLSKESRNRLPIYGTLDHTVHALNLPETCDHIKKKHHGSIVIAVDASLGSCEHIGSVFLRMGCLYPGAGVCKNLPGVGDIAITGIANSESTRPFLDLQTARLSTVSAMADRICGCILDVCLGLNPLL